METENPEIGCIDSFRGTYFFLSNMYECPIVYNGMTWRSSEHAYQAMKATNKIDMFKIKSARTPKLSKTIARQCEIRSDWEQVKVDIMREVVKAKFSDPELKAQLISTGDCELIEINTWYDSFWGEYINDYGDRVGLNWLGKLLMELRQSL